jgi:hypothetical protein
MPNDAKLGLLAGVIGVIAVAVVSANGPPTREVPIPLPAVAHAAGSYLPAVANNAENLPTHFSRTRPEPDGTPTSLKPTDDLEP